MKDADLEGIHGKQLYWLSFVNSKLTRQGLIRLAAQLPALQYANLAGSSIDPLDPVTTDGSDAIGVSQPDRLRKLESDVVRQAKRTGKNRTCLA